ncbi:MAG: methyltransferase domain-containing protein, partial [Actinobacteria bacterium]|nr:methyltransferase domain-containing protein [Actinomycetota bacterium]
MAGLRRYDLIACGYDLVSLEHWLYAGPRAKALELLSARPGDTVLDLGCGTGLNFAVLLDGVGENGRVIGVDASAGMLAAARKRVRTAGWDNVTLLSGDLTDLAGVLSGAGVEPTAIDSVTATYVLNLLTDDIPVWRTLTAMA